LLEKPWRNSCRQTILCGFLNREILALGAGYFQLYDLAILQVAEAQATRSGDEDVDDGPTQAEAARLTWKSADHPGRDLSPTCRRDAQVTSLDSGKTSPRPSTAAPGPQAVVAGQVVEGK
jgi:hypothetical protein